MSDTHVHTGHGPNKTNDCEGCEADYQARKAAEWKARHAPKPITGERLNRIFDSLRPNTWDVTLNTLTDRGHAHGRLSKADAMRIVQAILEAE